MRNDVFSPAQRSAVMRAVKSRDTGPERLVAKALCATGMRRRYRRCRVDLPGKPDFTLGALHKVIFVHGCFWHGHDCRRGARRPKRNAAYWSAKIAANRKRDREHAQALAARGYAILTLWECELRDAAALQARLRRFVAAI
jgi:DNA mismatch endonuclease (patch repair protein)